MNILSVKNITIRIEQKEIVKNLSLEIPEHKITTIIGPNGCGKSTTLKAISRILNCYKGEVFFREKNINKFSYKEFARKLAILTQ